METAITLLSAGVKPSASDRSIAENVAREIDALDLSDHAKQLIRQMIARSVKMSIPNVLSIWEIAQKQCDEVPDLQSQIIWIEDGNDKAGYQHMLKHALEFRQLGISETELREVAKAATQVGHLAGSQGGTPKRPGRPVFVLIYKNTPLAVAISIGSNGFLVGMNRQDFDKYLKEGPPFHHVPTYKSSNTSDMLPGTATFRGWVLRMTPNTYGSFDDSYEYHKNGQVTKSQNEEPKGEWTYALDKLGPADNKCHWYRWNFLKNSYQYCQC